MWLGCNVISIWIWISISFWIFDRVLREGKRSRAVDSSVSLDRIRFAIRLRERNSWTKTTNFGNDPWDIKVACIGQDLETIIRDANVNSYRETVAERNVFRKPRPRKTSISLRRSIAKLRFERNRKRTVVSTRGIHLGESNRNFCRILEWPWKLKFSSGKRNGRANRNWCYSTRSNRRIKGSRCKQGKRRIKRNEKKWKGKVERTVKICATRYVIATNFLYLSFHRIILYVISDAVVDETLPLRFNSCKKLGWRYVACSSGTSIDIFIHYHGTREHGSYPKE